jgi:signal transduction histidine kinase
MRVGTRLFSAVVPAALGVLAMAALAYWGQRGRQVPDSLLGVGIVAALVSLGLAWHNTRYVARRLRTLAGRRAELGADRAGDEIETIERAVAHAEEAGHACATAAEERAGSYAALLADAAQVMEKRLEEVRLPLHILLDNRFGDLNENQEEMIAAAYGAASLADERMRTLVRVLQVDTGEVRVDLQPIRPRDLISPVLAAAQARAAGAGTVFESDLSPALPHIQADVRLAREALALILEWLASSPAPSPSIRIAAALATTSTVAVRVAGVAGTPPNLAYRLLQIQGGELDIHGSELTVWFPVASRME